MYLMGVLFRDCFVGEKIVSYEVICSHEQPLALSKGETEEGQPQKPQEKNKPQIPRAGLSTNFFFFERHFMRQPATSKPEVISAIRAAKRRLKRTPTRSEFERLSGIYWTKVQRLFGGYRVAVREAGLEPDPGGIRIDTAAMLVDFARVARKVGRHPTRDEYERLGRYASASLETRFHRWSAVRESFLEFVARNGMEREWGDVAERLRNGAGPRRGGGKNWLKGDRRRMAKAKNNLPQINADPRQAGTGERR